MHFHVTCENGRVFHMHALSHLLQTQSRALKTFMLHADGRRPNKREGGGAAVCCGRQVAGPRQLVWRSLGDWQCAPVHLLCCLQTNKTAHPLTIPEICFLSCNHRPSIRSLMHFLCMSGLCCFSSEISTRSLVWLHAPW